MARWTDKACSFCGKSQDERRRLIAGPGVFICSECVALCSRVIADDRHQGPGPQAHRVAPRHWWRRGLVIAGRLLHQPQQRRPAWRGTVG